ncbi:MAG: twin-arginine translocation signal domain-containing protein [Bacteroidetes bacterium]|nr:twin-arginine translocation signal domain-containing protein [Bacteroidota bacterium]
MNRRHFIKLSGAGTAALLFSRLTSLAQGGRYVMDMPLDVYAISGRTTFRLLPSIGSKYTYEDIEAELIRDGEKLLVFVQSPKWELNAIRFTWKYDAGDYREETLMHYLLEDGN